MLQLHELTNTQHSITAHQGGTWTIDAITNAVTVQATNLDIRDLAFASDSVTAHQGGTWTIDAITNAVTVQATNLDIRDLSSATDSVSTVEQALNTWKTSQVSVTNSATQIAATPLTGRKRIIIQNVGAQDIYVKDANTVAAATDGKIAKGASFEMILGASATIYGITASGSSDIRVWEFAA